MRKTKVFKSGNSYAVRLPKEFRLNCDTVYIKREGNCIVLTSPRVKKLIKQIKDFTENFMIYNFDAKAAETYGKIIANLERGGNVIGAYDYRLQPMQYL